MIRDKAEIPKIVGIGSCRIFNPLRILARENRIADRSIGTAWYTHSTQDVLQKLQIVNGRKYIVNRERDLIVHDAYKKFNPDLHKVGIYEDCELFVVEITSARTLRFKDIIVQQWCLRDLLISHGVSPDLFMSILSVPSDQRDVSALPLELREMAAHGEAEIQSTDSIVSDLKLIRSSLIKPLVLVPHINVPTRDGSLVPDRKRIAKILEEFCREFKEVLFDPGPIIVDHGYDFALRDFEHYTPEFEHVIAHRLFDVLRKALGK